MKALGFEAPKQLTRGRQASLPYAQMAEFMADLRSRDALAARALRVSDPDWRTDRRRP